MCQDFFTLESCDPKVSVDVLCTPAIGSLCLCLLWSVYWIYTDNSMNGCQWRDKKYFKHYLILLCCVLNFTDAVWKFET